MTDPFSSDIRASAIEYKRSRSRAAKWKYSAASAGNSWPANADEGVIKKSRPGKALWKQPHFAANYNKGVLKTSTSQLRHDGARTAHAGLHARLEAADYSVPFDDPISPLGSDNAGDKDVFFSFDSDASPASSLGLDSLVDRAETMHREKVIEKLVKDEYEVLDDEGESVNWNRKGRKIKCGTEVTKNEEDVDGEWETVFMVEK